MQKHINWQCLGTICRHFDLQLLKLSSWTLESACWHCLSWFIFRNAKHCKTVTINSPQGLDGAPWTVTQPKPLKSQPTYHGNHTRHLNVTMWPFRMFRMMIPIYIYINIFHYIPLYSVIFPWNLIKNSPNIPNDGTKVPMTTGTSSSSAMTLSQALGVVHPLNHNSLRDRWIYATEPVSTTQPDLKWRKSW